MPVSLFQQHVTSIVEQQCGTREKIYRLLKKHFLQDKSWRPSELTMEEYQQLQILKAKYHQDSSFTQESGSVSKGICYTEF